MNEIKERLEHISAIIEEAGQKGSHSAGEVRLIAVSKTKPVEDMLLAYECGARDFGENYVQEIVEKYDKIPEDARIHMIGHLQTNKVGKIIDKVCMIHSVDSDRLLKEIEKQAVKHEVECMPVLLEINVAEEESKFGFCVEEIEDILKLSKDSCPHVLIKGFMTSAPITEDAESNRQYFRKLKELADRFELPELSMGMTGDYIVAVEEGATMVRIGTAIFGKRDYSK